ncbi:MAG TPA: methyltransferase domain-containing protein [Candidatus Moranbacteria bacterium]|nr:methyltransferase domain-containing protein [Candidatus Moranbacteria bacterium]
MRIIDIGAGTRPIPNCDVYFDQSVKPTEDRKAISGKLPNTDYFGNPIYWIIGNVEAMTFKKKEFDFSYCRSVLEHTNLPHKACNEIIRISKAGYITSPSPTIERTRPNSAHKWYVWTDNGYMLNFRHKALGYPIPAIKEQFSGNLMEFFWKNTFFYTVYYNNGKIITNK